MPRPMMKTSGIVGTRNAVLKYGGPTEILPRPSASMNNGYSVPNSTSIADTTRSMLFSRRNVSRDSGEKPPDWARAGARQA